MYAKKATFLAAILNAMVHIWYGIALYYPIIIIAVIVIINAIPFSRAFKSN